MIPPPLVALGAGVGQRLLAGPPGPRSAARIASASGVALASGALAVTAARTFRRLGTTLDPREPSQASVLVTTGPHAVTRNPMYLGLTGMLIANAVRLGSWRALVPTVAFMVVIDRVQIPLEEAALLDRFGAEYENYRATVPRWIGLRTVVAGARPR